MKMMSWSRYHYLLQRAKRRYRAAKSRNSRAPGPPPQPRPPPVAAGVKRRYFQFVIRLFRT